MVAPPPYISDLCSPGTLLAVPLPPRKKTLPPREGAGGELPFSLMAILLAFDGIRPTIHPSAWIAPTATIVGNVVVEEEASIWFGAVLRGDDPERVIHIGARTSIQDNCVIHVSGEGPTLIGADVTVGHGAVLQSCTVGRGALIGMNAVVLQRATIGEAALIAAGSVVAAGAEIPPRHLAAGAPARVTKEIEAEAFEWVGRGADHYVELGRKYRQEQTDRADSTASSPRRSSDSLALPDS